MTYPSSSDVAAGQPTASSHYNTLRADALTLAQAAADSLTIGSFFSRFAQYLLIEYLATNRLRITVDNYNPPAIVIGGCLLKATANVDLAASSFTGAAATYFIHAVRVAGSTSFTLSVNTSATDNDTSRVIGTCYWDGAAVSSISSYYSQIVGMPDPNYDSGWFAVAYNNTYTKTHGLGDIPRMFLLLHSTSSTGASEQVWVGLVKDGTPYYTPIGFDSSVAYVQTGTDATAGVIQSKRRVAANGYYRLLCWL